MTHRNFTIKTSPWRALLMVALFAPLLQGCVTDGANGADSFADAANMQRQETLAGTFRIATYSRIEAPGKPISVYIDGDVRGWAPTTDPGVDPVVDDLLGLRLASIDESPNVLFVAAPCHMVSDDPACSGKPWTEGAVAPQVLASINRAIDRAVASFQRPRIHLVGYSGGGAIAALLAAQRRDVESLRTIAGNLDPAGAERAHAANPQEDVVDPMGSAHWLSRMPQAHLVGGKDAFVPPFLTANFVKAVGKSRCVHMLGFADAGHTEGWEDIWRKQYASIPSCK